MPGHKSDYLEFGVKVGLDSKEAQKELQELQKQLNSLGTLSNPKIGDKLSADMQKASQAAAKLKVALDSAIDIDTGKLDLSKFSRSLKNSGMNLKQYRDQLMSMGPEGEKAFTQVANSVLKAEAPLRRTSKLIDTMWTTLKNTARWELSSSILHGLESSLQKAVTYAQDLNKSLTDIRIVTGYSTDYMADFAVEANKAAKALSATTTEYTNASLIYFQQGLSDQQVKERTEVTVKMANVTRDSAQTVSDQMTAVWNNFADGSHTLEYYADVMTALGAATASSTKEISDGLEKFAAVAETVGLSYEYAASALATITSNTRQSADVVGTALKTLFARIQGLSLGETLEDGTDLNKYSEALAKVGIQVKEQNGELKAMDDILNEMADVWDKLNNDQQVALAQTVAGVRQYTQLVALMENWDNGDEDSMMANLNTSANATGALQEQADVYAESWEAARDRVTAALESIFNKLLKDEFFIDTLNNIEKIITGIDKFIDSIGGLQGVLTGLGAVATKVFSSQISSGLSNLAYNLNFKQAQEADKKMRIDAANLAGNMLADSVDAKPAQADAMKAIGKIQIDMINNSNKMSDIEKQLMNFNIEKLKIIAEQNAEYEKQIQIQSQQINENKEKNINKATAYYQEQGLNKKDASKKAKNTISNYEKDLLNRDKVSKQFKKSLEELEQIEKKSGKTSEEYGKALEKNKKATEELAEANKKLKKSKIEYKNATGATNKELSKISKEYKIQAKNIEELDKRTNKFDQHIKDLNNSLNNSSGNIITWSDSIVKAGNGIISISFGITAVANAFTTLADPDIDGWQKLLTVLSALSMGLPSLIMGGKELAQSLAVLAAQKIANIQVTENMTNKMIAEAIAEKASNQAKKRANIETTKSIALNTADAGAQAADAAGKTVNTTATGLLGAAQAFLNGQYAIALLYLLPYIAAIALLVAAVAGVVAVYKQWSKVTSEKQAEMAAESLKETTKAAEQAKNAYDQLITSVNKYNESVSKIDKTTQSMKEYSDSIKEANKNAKELIQTYGLYNDWYYDSEGIIRFNQSSNDPNKTVLDEAIDKAEIQVLEANINVQSAKIVSEQNKQSNAIESASDKFLYGKDYSSEEKLWGSAISGYVKAFLPIVDEGISLFKDTRQVLNGTLEPLEYAKRGLENISSMANPLSPSLSDGFKIGKELGKTLIEGIKEEKTIGEISSNIASNIVKKTLKDYLNFSSITPITSIANEAIKSNITQTKTEENINSLVSSIASLGEEAIELINFDDIDSILETLEKNGIELSDSWENLLQDEDLRNSLKELALSSIEAAEAMNYFAHEIASSEVEKQYGDWAKEIASSNGELNQGLYDAIIRIITNKYTDAEEDSFGFLETDEFASNLSKARGSTLGLSGLIPEISPGASEADLAKKYGSILYGVSEDDISYNKKTNTISYGEQSTTVTPEFVRGEIYRNYETEKAQEKYSDLISNDESLKEIIDNNLNSTTSLSNQYGENFQSILFNAIATAMENPENVDLSALFSELNPSEWEGLMNAENPLEFLKMLGLTPEILEELGVESAAIFAHAARDSLATYDSESYLESADTKGEKAAEEAGVDVEKFEKYRDILESTTDAYDDNREGLNKVALANLRLDEGVKTLADDWDDLNKIMSDPNADPYEMADALTKIEPALQNILNLNTEQFELLPPDFAKKNWKLIQDVVNGVEGAVDDLRNIAGEEILLNIEGTVDADGNLKEEIAKLHTYISNMDQEQFTVGVALDPETQSEFIEQCNNIIAAAGMTAEQAQAYFASMGYDVTLKKDTEPITQEHTVKWPKYEDPAHPLTVTSWGKETWQDTSEAQALAIETITPNGSYGGGIEVKDAASSSASSSKSSGGDSGSSAEPLEYEDEIERYHENTRALERLTRALEKVSTAKDRAFGKERLRLIDEEIAATERLVAQQRAYIAEAKQYLKQDYAEIQQYGFTTDQYGELTNYDEVMKQQIDKYNAAVATGNQDAIDAAKEQYDEFKENMEQYEETLTLYEEAQAQLQDYINQVVDLKLEKITTEVEIKLRVNDKELTKLEYLLKKIEYEGKGAADAIGLIGKQFEQVNQKAETVREAIDKIYKQAREEGRGFTDEEIAEAQALYEGGLTPEEEIRLQEIHQKVIDEDRALTQAEEDQILEYQEMLLEYNSEVMDYVETVEGKFIETFDELNGAVDETIGRFATYTGMLETLKDVITLTGKANTKYGKDLMSQFSARTVANASAAMRSNIASYNNLNKQYEAQQESLARAIEAGDERFIQTQKEYLEHVELARETAYEAMLTSWSDVLQASSDLFDARLDEMIFNLKQNLGDIDTLVEIYDRAIELEELYVSGNKSIYELSKLARDIGKDIDATSNLIAKNKLTGLLEQINKLRAEGVKLSEYDLEYWQAKYELELAEIALQEAQEAKSQIKLTRNNVGGWGYMYTADAEAIAEAEQNYEDSLYNMQSIHEEYISDYSERFLKNQQEMADELHNIDKERADYEEEVMRVRDHYFKQQEYLMNELNKAYERSGIGFKDTILGQQSEFSTLEQYYQNFIDSSSEMIENEFIDSYKLWQQQVQDANNEMGKNLEDFAENISNTSDTLEDKVISKIDEMGITMEETSNKIWDFQENYGAAIAKMIEANEEFFDKTAKDYNNFISETAIGEYLKNQEAFMSTGDVLGLTGNGGMGATSYGGLGAAGSASSALNGWLGSLNSATGRSSSSKSSSSKDSTKGNRDGTAYVSPTGYYSTSTGIWTWSANQDHDDVVANLKEQGYNVEDVDSVLDGMNKDRKDKGVQEIGSDHEDYDRLKELSTGGYTGSWGAEGRLAILHEKELVLNKYDTENMLNMVNTLRDIDWRAKIAELWPSIEEKFIMPALNQAEELLQEVHIEANFPGISDRNELEEAFHNLINTASQYANRKRY